MSIFNLFSGPAPLFSNPTKLISGISSDDYVRISQADASREYGQVSVVQTGYFVPNETGDHQFKIRAGAGAFLAINGVTLINTTASTLTTSANISLTVGKSYSFVFSASLATQGAADMSVQTFVYNVGGGSDKEIQDNQIYSINDPLSNPLYSANSVLQAMIASQTPAYLNPIANIMPTDISFNNSIATVPCPAIIPSNSNSVLNSMNNAFLYPLPAQTPQTCYRDIVIMPPVVDITRPNPTVSQPSGTYITTSSAGDFVTDGTYGYAKSKYWLNHKAV